MDSFQAQRCKPATGLAISEQARDLRRQRLALGLSIALCTSGALESAPAIALNSASPELRTNLRATADPRQPQIASQTWLVQNCNNDGPGSLRSVVTTVAQTGDTVDLSQLNCSTITLFSGEVLINQSDLTLLGPEGNQGSLTISGNQMSRVFHHEGQGTLRLTSLTIADGYAHSYGIATAGGCILSVGSITLTHTTVENCALISDDDAASGGGISAFNAVTLLYSTVSSNEVIAPANAIRGGGINTDNLVAKYSSITNNIANSTPGGSYGGGAFSRVSATIMSSTIDNNYAGTGGGGLFIGFGYGSIANSTISGNIAGQSPAVKAADPTLVISNSTVAFNHALMDTSTGAVVFDFVNGGLSLNSSIITNNTAGANNLESDLYIQHGILSGADNLVITTNQSPPGVITVTADPKLGPLQFNGGWTRTHALLPGSPAIGTGNKSALAPPYDQYDQRGLGYPRTTGPAATTDIGAFQFDSIFYGGFE